VEPLDHHGRPVDVAAPESTLTIRVRVQYMKDVHDSVVNIKLRDIVSLCDIVGLFIFSANTTLEKTPVGDRGAGERVIVGFTFQVPLKYGRYSVAVAVSHLERKELHLDRISVVVAFKLSHPSGRNATLGLGRLPTRVEIFEPDGVRQRKPRS
jgi:hypothetical protein